jgi:hypothetical protein
VYLSGQGVLKSISPDELMVSSGMDVEMDSLRVVFAALLVGLSLFSPGVVGLTEVEVALTVAADLKSKAVPGVFGVLVADPKDAKAPEPRPKAVEPPVVGEASPPDVNGETPLNGFLPPCDESPPNRFAAEKVRSRWSGFSFCCSECDMDRESLLVLELALVLRAHACGEKSNILGAAGPEILPIVHWYAKARYIARVGIKLLCLKLGGIKE